MPTVRNQLRGFRPAERNFGDRLIDTHEMLRPRRARGNLCQVSLGNPGSLGTGLVIQHPSRAAFLVVIDPINRAPYLHALDIQGKGRFHALNPPSLIPQSGLRFRKPSQPFPQGVRLNPDRRSWLTPKTVGNQQCKGLVHPVRDLTAPSQVSGLIAQAELLEDLVCDTPIIRSTPFHPLRVGPSHPRDLAQVKPHRALEVVPEGRHPHALRNMDRWPLPAPT